MKLLRTTIAAALCAASAAAGGGVLITATAHAQSRGQGATSCVENTGYQLRNNCSYEIEVAWCAETTTYSTYKCDGELQAQTNLGPGRVYDHFGGTGYVRWAACVGRDSVHIDGYNAYCE